MLVNKVLLLTALVAFPALAAPAVRFSRDDEEGLLTRDFADEVELHARNKFKNFLKKAFHFIKNLVAREEEEELVLRGLADGFELDVRDDEEELMIREMVEYDDLD